MRHINNNGEQKAGFGIAQAADNTKNSVEYRKWDKGNGPHAHILNGISDQQRFYFGIKQVYKWLGKKEKGNAKCLLRL